MVTALPEGDTIINTAVLEPEFESIDPTPNDHIAEDRDIIGQFADSFEVGI